MNKIFTSVEQSQKLIKLGIDINTADLSYLQLIGEDKDYNITLKTVGEHLSSVWHPQLYNFLPAWTLSALLELMPNVMGETPTIKKQINGNKWACWYDSWHIIKQGDNPLDAAFEMVCWLLENKKL